MKIERYMNMCRVSIAIVMMFALPCAIFSQDTNNDSVRIQPVDSAYIAQIEALIRQSEQEDLKQVNAIAREKEAAAQIKQIVEKYNHSLMKKEMEFDYKNLLPLAAGFVSLYTRHDFIHNHPAVFEKTNSSAKDYVVAGSPLVAAWILKAAGVESRSTTRRMATANGFALALAAGLTYGTKHIVNEQRPDMSDSHSFPSGHAALAYVGATVLSREYGHISPWITVGGYSAATATELLRIKHNAHWLNDLYMGAGIGVVSTNFGYWLADRIYGEKGINKPEMRKKDLLRAMKMYSTPSSIALVASTDLGKNYVSADNLVSSENINSLGMGDYHLHLSTMSLVGVEGSWFLNPFLAIEALAQSSMGQAKVYYTSDPYVLGEDRTKIDKTFTGNVLQVYRASVALKGSIPVPGTTNRFALRALAGVRSINKTSFYLTDINEYKPDENYNITLPRNTKFEIGCGLSYDALETTSHVVGFNFDYYHAFSKVTPNRFIISTVYKVLF